MTRPLSVFCCTITPFDEQGALSGEALRQLVERLASGGVGAFVGTSSPGEGFSLSLDETEQLYGGAKEAMAGRYEVRAMGIEPRSAEETARLIKIAESVGLDAMQLYSLDLGHSNQPTPDELERFFRTNLDQMTIPAVLSTHFMLGYVIPIPVLERLLADYPGIIGVNCTSPNVGYLREVLDVADGRVDVHVGGPQQAVTALAMGAQGFLCTEATLAPALCGSLVALWASGDLPAAFTAYERIMAISAVNQWPGGSLRFTKAAMRVMGIDGWQVRPPYLPLDEQAREQIRSAFEQLDIDELHANGV